MASDVIIGLPTVQLSHEETARLRGELRRLAVAGDEIEELLAGLVAAAHALPRDLVEAVLSLRADPDSPGMLLVRGMPIDEELPPTPIAPVAPTFSPGPVGRCAILQIAVLLGEPVGYAAEKDGALVQNVFPTPEQAEKPSNESSSVGLGFHTELTFSRDAPEQSFGVAAPDFVLLLALRSSEERSAVTWLIRAGDICGVLDPSDVEALRQPDFELRAPHSFTQDTGSRPWSDPLALIEGPEDHPAVIFDTSCGVRARTERADRALAALRDACAEPSIQYSVSLREGDLLVIDNHKCAHARSPYEARFDGGDRWLHRAYVRQSIRGLKSAPDRSFRVLA